MISTRIQSTVVAFVLLAGSPVAWADTLDDAIGKITSAMAGIQSMRYTTKYTIDTQGTGFDMRSTGTATLEYKRVSDDDFRLRNEIKSKTTQGDGESKDETTLMIFDGKHHYTLMIAGEQKSAFRMANDKSVNMNPNDGQAVFAAQRQAGNLKLLPDESVGGKSCYVIETVHNSAGDGASGKARMVTHYDKKTGIGMKTVSYDSNGKVTLTSETTDVKTGLSIPDDRFVFKAPPGVQVIDSGAAQAQAQAAEEADDSPATEKKAAAKPSDEKKPAAKETKTAAKEEEAKPAKEEKKKGLGGLLKKIKIP